MHQVITNINEFQQTFTITLGEAYINGYVSDGEVFMVSVPKHQRRQGIAKRLLKAANEVITSHNKTLSFTSAISQEGKAMIEWWESQ